MHKVLALLAAGTTWWAILGVSPGLQAAEPEGPVRATIDTATLGRTVAEFRLRDTQGAWHALADYSDAKLVVLAFIGTECPLVRLYAPRLRELAEQYASQGVQFFAVSSNRQDSITELAAFARESAWPFPVLKDLSNELADRVGAVRTPEVFVLDASRAIRYRGRIDDQFGFTAQGASYHRPEPTVHELALAIEQVLAGGAVATPQTDAPGCRIGRIAEPQPNAEVTYSNQIARLLNERCVSCHRPGQIAPFALTDYEEVAGWAEMIGEVVSNGRMPPWHADEGIGHFANAARLSAAENELVERWVAAGAPEGDRSDLPPAPALPVGWNMPEPDEVLYMDDQPFEVPANGVIEYQEFVVDPGWKEDRWIQAIEARPGNPAVVHHILVFVLPPQKFVREFPGRPKSDWLTGYAPGLRQETLPEGWARLVPAGAKLAFQMHYTPNGAAQTDRSYLGVKFADPQKVKQELIVASAANYEFAIPPGEAAHRVEASYTFGRDALLVSLIPHMHLRGKDFLYDAVYPDGRRERLLSVSHYDFGWQTIYQLDEPRRMPAGTKLECVAHFDNSPENLNNPDPQATVTFGEQTFDEMMIGFFEMAPLDAVVDGRPARLSRVDEFRQLIAAGAVQLSDRQRASFGKALTSEGAFVQSVMSIAGLLPQVDRVCVTIVEPPKLRLAAVIERPPFDSDWDWNSVTAPAANERLVEIAAGETSVVLDNLIEQPRGIARHMGKHGLQSSLHVPIRLGDKQGTLNLWSLERQAFPPEAVKLAEVMARLMCEPNGK
ncbi:MAG: redoxin domain-containing protein [Pirellulales bacterium]|nr:redoxin domain-containing protein [Pirellulales bacterium]